jgi:hypothetical protein
MENLRKKNETELQKKKKKKRKANPATEQTEDRISQNSKMVFKEKPKNY